MTDQRPLCPEHPDQPSVGTCARCGRFACASCFHAGSGRCTACAARYADVLGIGAKPFSVGHVLVSAWTLARTALPTVVGVSVLMMLSSFAVNRLQLLEPAPGTPGPEGWRAALGPMLIATLRALMLGTFLYGALLAQMAGAAQGEAVSVPAALWRSARAYPRLFWAQLVATVLTVLGALLCVVPGIYAAVVLSVIFCVAYLDPDSPVVATSAELTRGRRWELLALLLITRGVVVGITAISGALVLALEQLGFSRDNAGTMLDVLGLAVDLIQELIEAFDVALMLAAYLSLRSDRERALDVPILAASAAAPAPAPATASLFRSS